MKVAFYFQNVNLDDKDLSQPERGNPGIGGTEYQFLLIFTELTKIRYDLGSDFEVLVICNKVPKLSPLVDFVIADSLEGALEVAAVRQIDIFVFRPKSNLDEISKCAISKTHMRVLPWFHITPNEESLNFFANAESVAACVFVGQDQRMRRIDHKIYEKSVTIFNCYPDLGNRNELAISTNQVTYLGALVPAKGFHVLAEIWPIIWRLRKSSTLKVIGTGNIYQNSLKMGTLGIASFEYENSFMRHLQKLEDSGFRESVEFKGLLGVKKEEVLIETAVGVVNPTGQTENCPISAIEFSMKGIPIVTSKKYGMRDMIIHGDTGFGTNRRIVMILRIIKLLSNQSRNFEMGKKARQFALTKFSIHNSLQNWTNLFRCVNNKSSLPPNLQLQSKGYIVYKISKVFRKYPRYSSLVPTVERIRFNLLRGRQSLFRR
jgi:glycosyltransferase involved in cell wall biosynthesis